MLVGHATFNCPTVPDINSTAEEARFPVTCEKTEIAWIMMQNKGNSFFRSVHYRRELNLKYLVIPMNAVHFVTLFLDDLHDRWSAALERVKSYQVTRVRHSIAWWTVKLICSYTLV